MYKVKWSSETKHNIVLVFWIVEDDHLVPWITAASIYNWFTKQIYIQCYSLAFQMLVFSLDRLKVENWNRDINN